MLKAKKTSKIFAFLAVMLIVVSIIPMSAFAAAPPEGQISIAPLSAGVKFATLTVNKNSFKSCTGQKTDGTMDADVRLYEHSNFYEGVDSFNMSVGTSSLISTSSIVDAYYAGLYNLTYNSTALAANGSKTLYIRYYGPYSNATADGVFYP